MDSEAIKDFLSKIPAIPLMMAWLAYLGYDYWSFQNDPGTEFHSRTQQISTLNAEIQALDGKLKQVAEFEKNFEAKKVELRNITLELDSMKTTISETLDIADFMRTTVTEAKRIGLQVISFKPTKFVPREDYAEQHVEFVLRGVYVQLVLFLERLANMQKVVRADNFEIKPIGSAASRYVPLEMKIETKAYKYVVSRADSLGTKEPQAQTSPVPAPAATAKGGTR